MISINRTQSTKFSKANLLTNGWEAFPVKDADHLSNAMMKFPFSPIVWRRGYRSSQNFISADWLVLDFDSGELTLDEAVNDFCDMVHVIGTTKSHRISKKTNSGGIKPACDRFRVAFKFESPIFDLFTYQWQLKELAKHLPIDRACKDGGRFFYPCTKIVSVENEGFMQEIIKAPKHRKLYPKNKFEKNGLVTPKVQKILDNFQVGNRSNDCVLLGKYLAPFGFDVDQIFQIILNTDCVKKNPLSDADVKDFRHSITQGIKYFMNEDTKR